MGPENGWEFRALDPQLKLSNDAHEPGVPTITSRACKPARTANQPNDSTLPVASK